MQRTRLFYRGQVVEAEDETPDIQTAVLAKLRTLTIQEVCDAAWSTRDYQDAEKETDAGVMKELVKVVGTAFIYVPYAVGKDYARYSMINNWKDSNMHPAQAIFEALNTWYGGNDVASFKYRFICRLFEIDSWNARNDTAAVIKNVQLILRNYIWKHVHLSETVAPLSPARP